MRLALVLILVLAGCAAPAAETVVPSPAATPAPPTVAPLSAPAPEAPASPAPEPEPTPACPADQDAVAGGCRALLGAPDARNLEPSLSVSPTDPRRAIVAWTVREHLRVVDVSLGTTGRVFAAATEDGGATWRTTELVHPDAVDLAAGERHSFDQRALYGADGVARVLYIGELPRVATNGAGPGRITIASSADGGATWTYTRVADLPGARFDYLAFAEAPDTGHLHVATDEQSTGGVWTWRSEDGGASWEGPVVVAPSRAPHGYHGLPALAALPGGVVLLATRVTTPPDDPLARGTAVWASEDGGVTWGAPARVVEAPLDALDKPVLASAVLADGAARVMLLAASEADGLFAAESDGATWREPVRVGEGAPFWAVAALGAEGRWATLQRDDEGDASAYTLTLGRVDGATRVRLDEGVVPFAGSAGDDYGGLALAADGAVWSAYARGEGRTERIAVHVIR